MIVKKNIRYTGRNNKNGKNFPGKLSKPDSLPSRLDSLSNAGIQLRAIYSSVRKTVSIKKVQPHPAALETYKKKNLDSLRITMHHCGLLEPVKVIKGNDGYLVYDGLSRYYCALQLGWNTINIEIVNIPESAVNDIYILINVRPVRSLTEKIEQAQKILAALGTSQGKKRTKLGNIEPPDTHIDPAGKDRYELACAVLELEFSPTTLRKLIAVKEFVDKGDDEVNRMKLLEKLETGEMKPNTAFSTMNRYQKEKKEKESETSILFEALNHWKGNFSQLINKTCENLDLLKDNSINLTVTSPPYFRQRLYNKGTLPVGETPHGEEETVDQYVSKQLKVFTEVLRKTKENGSLFIINSDSFDRTRLLVTEKLVIGLEAAGWYYQDRWVWKKNQKPQAVNGRLLPTYENILHFTKHLTDYKFREYKHWRKDEEFKVVKSGKRNDELNSKGWSLKKPLERFKNFLDEQHVARIIESSVFQWTELQEIDRKFKHPAPFPSYIPLLPILMCSKPGDTVLDIYNGTSTSTAVALQLGRNVIGYETDTKSHEFAVKRLSMVEENLPSIADVQRFENDYMEPAA